MSTMPIYLKMLELDAYTTASPLAAQYLVANHYHLAPRVEIREAATGDPATEKVVAGRMHFDLMSPFLRAVIGWAGVVGECLHDDGFANPRELADWVEDHFEWGRDNQACSPSDTVAIHAYPQERRALLRACEILLSRSEEHLAIVKQATASLMQNRGSVFVWPLGSNSSWPDFQESPVLVPSEATAAAFRQTETEAIGCGALIALDAPDCSQERPWE